MLNKVKLASVALALSMGVFTATCANAAAPILGEMIKDGQCSAVKYQFRFWIRRCNTVA